MNQETNFQMEMQKRLKQIKLYSKPIFLKTLLLPNRSRLYILNTVMNCVKASTSRQNDSGKLTLKKIWFSYNGNNKGKQNPYVFNYNPKKPGLTIPNLLTGGENYKEPIENPGFNNK
jgi:hypothetical protein